MHTHWKAFAALAAAITTVGTISVVVAVRWGGAAIGWFVAGALYGFVLVGWLTFFELLDPVTRRFTLGAEGEEFTELELRRCRRDGWVAVHNVHLQPGDIDHVAIGPGGVIAIETKHSGATWNWLRDSGTARRWARTARDSASRSRALVKQYAGVSVDVSPIVVVWGSRDLRDAGSVEIDGVRFLHGRQLVGFLENLGPMLEPQAVASIHQALDGYTTGLREYRAARGLTVASA